MSSDQNKAVARRFFAAIGSGDTGTLDDLLTPDFVAHLPGSPGPLDHDGLVHVGHGLAAAFTEGGYAVEGQLAETDKVATRVKWRAVHSGDFQGVPATGKQIQLPGIAIMRFQDGKIAEHTVQYDLLNLMQQIGAMPAPRVDS
jgi:steroid delta-isomerase-like uncharacterized protein